MWKLAWRQLLRNRARTLITGSAIALAVALFLLSLALGDGMYGKMMEAAERSAGGGVLIHHAGWWKSRESTAAVTTPEPAIAAAEATPGVRAVAPRVILEGVLTSASNEGFAAVTMRGVDPAAERPFNVLSRFLTRGDFLTGDDPRGLVLGQKLTEDLSIELGDRVVLRFTDARGEEAQALFRLRGVVATGSADIDRGVVLVRLATAQEVAGLAGGVTEKAATRTPTRRVGHRPDTRLVHLIHRPALQPAENTVQRGWHGVWLWGGRACGSLHSPRDSGVDLGLAPAHASRRVHRAGRAG